MRNRTPARWALLALTVGASSCRYDGATDACYAVAEGIGDRLADCGYVATPAEGEQAVLDSLAADGLSCDTSPIGIRDEASLYDECIPQLMTYDCAAIVNSVPAPCQEQIIYRSR